MLLSFVTEFIPSYVPIIIPSSLQCVRMKNNRLKRIVTIQQTIIMSSYFHPRSRKLEMLVWDTFFFPLVLDELCHKGKWLATFFRYVLLGKIIYWVISTVNCRVQKRRKKGLHKKSELNGFTPRVERLGNPKIKGVHLPKYRLFLLHFRKEE